MSESFYINGNFTKSIEAYFDFLSDTLDVPKVYKYFKNETIVSDGFKLHLDVYTYHPKSPTIVFIPGTGTYAMCYAEVLYKLGEEGYNIIGVDPRGHGRSEGPRGDYTIEEIMTDVQNVISFAIEKFNKRVTVMGCSQGGIAAFYLAAKEERIQTVVCQNFADLSSHETFQLTRHPNLSRFIRPFISGYTGSLSSVQIPISFYLDLESIKIKYFGNARNFLERDPLALQTISLRALRSLSSSPIPKPVEQITTPVMVFQGTEDTIFPVDYTQKIYHRLTNKKHFELFEGLSHAILTENVDTVLPSILDWLKSIYSRKRKIVDFLHLSKK